MTLEERQALIAKTDAVLAENEPKVGQQDEATAIDIKAIIDTGIMVLTAVHALLWWKPKWQTAVANIIAFLQPYA